MSDRAPLLIDRGADGVAVVTLNRPERRNALDNQLIESIATAMGDLDADADVAAIVLTGTDPAFCAGLDLADLGAGRLRLEAAAFPGVGPGRPWAPLTKVVIGAVNGAAVTGGLELALNCDFLVASERASFADTHARVGILPGWGLTVLLPQAVGLRRAREMSYTGNFMNAGEALRCGLVNRVVSHADVVPVARSLAADIAANDRRAVPALKASYDRIAAEAFGTDAGLRAENEAARAWHAAGARSGAAEVESRRAAIVERGRAQAVRP